MPELPEAETIARGLHSHLAGHLIRRARVHRKEAVEPMTPTTFARSLSGRRVRRVRRRAKWIAAELDDGRRWVTQLRMTGRFTWGQVSPLRAQPHLSVSLLITGEGGDLGVVRFFDTRRFGRMSIVDRAAWKELDARLGIEPLSDEFTEAELRRRLAPSRAPLRNALLDQTRIAGIGNIYANEICYLAEIDPRRTAGTLTDSETSKLRDAIRNVLAEAVGRRGTSFSDYRDLLGSEGDFQNHLEVYGRAGDRCGRCGTEIARTVLAGRSAFFCPACQR